jgi:enoyl-CoA hydratase/carnithine racemase
MSANDETALLYEVSDGIAYVTMNRPDRLNAIDGNLAERMHDAWERFEADPEARVAILSGRGRAFCAGQDITPGALDESVPHQSHRAYPENGKKVFKPIVSAIHGHVAGAGYSLGIRGADITIAADTALITFPEPRSGVPVPPIQYQPYLPFKISMEFMLLAWRGGKPIGAQRAYHFGLVNAVVPEAELMKEAREWANLLMKIPSQYIKSLKYGHYQATETRMITHEREYFDYVHPQVTSGNAREGLRAFLEKREPKFT